MNPADSSIQPSNHTVTIIGAGLAGSEAAWQLARCGIPVRLHEMRRMNSLIMRCGDAARIPAGTALAVDREQFSALVTGGTEKGAANRDRCG